MTRRRLIISFLIFLSASVFAADDSWMLYDDSQVAVVHIEIDPGALAWMYQEGNLNSDSLHQGRMHFQNAYIDEWVEDIGFRLRGNTSRGSAKKSFKVSFNTYVPGREFYDVDKLNLNGEHNDPSIIRSKLCWDFFGKIGVTASRASHAAVYINDEYYGLYISVEHIDDEFVNTHFADGTGNLWKCLYPADLTYRGSAPSAYYPYFDETRPYELKTNEETYDYSDLAHLIDVLNNTPDGSLAGELEKVINVPGVLKYFAANVLTGSWDDYWSLMNNFYLYHEPGRDLFHLIPYDYDNTFGVDWFDIEWAQADPYDFPMVNSGSRPLATRLMENTEYRNLYTHFLEFFNNTLFQWYVWAPDVYALKEMMTPWAEIDDYRKMDYGFDAEGGTDDFNTSFDQSDFSFAHVKQSIKTFVLVRSSSLPGQLSYTPMSPVVYDVTYIPLEPGPGDSITISAAAFDHEGLAQVQVFVDYDGQAPYIAPMVSSPVPGTQRVEEVDRYVCTLPPLSAGQQLSIYVEAFDNSSNSGRFPASGFIGIQAAGESSAGLRLNEVMALNGTILADQFDEYDDWIEIYNPTGEDIGLSGMYLTDSPDNLTQWQFPFGGVMLEAGGFLLVWCDDDEEQGPLHTTFRLSGDGEYLALVADDGVTIIDSYPFGPQTEDISMGRYPDGTGSWIPFPNPTPGAANISPANIPPVIASSSHEPGHPQVTDSVTVVARVTDESGLLSVRVYYDAGTGYQSVSMYDDGEHGDGAAGDNFYGGTIPPQTIGTTVRYYISAEDDSSAVTTDPEDAPGSTYSYSVGYSPPALFINEFMADNDNTLQDEAGQYDDWIEVYNAETFEVNLGGMYLTDDLANPTKWLVPNTVIGAGGVVLFWADEDQDQGPLHTNFKLGKGGEELAIIDIDGVSVIDSVTFGEQTTDVSYGRYPDGGETWRFFDAPTPGEKNAESESGDVNGDGAVNVLDVLAVVNHILGVAPLTGDALTLADCNADGSVNVLDALGIANVILGLGECGP